MLSCLILGKYLQAAVGQQLAGFAAVEQHIAAAKGEGYRRIHREIDAAEDDAGNDFIAQTKLDGRFHAGGEGGIDAGLHVAAFADGDELRTDAEGNVLPEYIATETVDWYQLWSSTYPYADLTIPKTPQTPGKYSLYLYFDGGAVVILNFTISE